MKSWLDYHSYFSNGFKIVKERTKYKIYCKCGHSMIFYPIEKKDRKLCEWCGHYVYKDKRIEFKYRLNKLLKIEGALQ